MPSYHRLLLDRRWQRRRLDVFSRADWKCVDCGDDKDENPLHAHHLLYVPGHAPWEYADGEIISVCDACHADRHGKRETDRILKDLQKEIEVAHAHRQWDDMARLARAAQDLIDEGAFYKGLV